MSLLLREDLTGEALPILGAGALLGLVFIKFPLVGDADKGLRLDADGVHEPCYRGRMPVSAFIKASLNSGLLSLPSSS